jgi:hypothetical protein
VRRFIAVMAACFAVMVMSEGHAQTSAESRSARAPLPPMEPEPGDIWADVRSWTTPSLPQPPGKASRSRAAPPAQDDATPQPAASAAPVAAGTTRSATTNATRRSNIRASPDLGAPVARSAAPSTTLKVFGEAPGGWFQVGDDQPFGWIHRSALRR